MLLKQNIFALKQNCFQLLKVQMSCYVATMYFTAFVHLCIPHKITRGIIIRGRKPQKELCE